MTIKQQYETPTEYKFFFSVVVQKEVLYSSNNNKKRYCLSLKLDVYGNRAQ